MRQLPLALLLLSLVSAAGPGPWGLVPASTEVEVVVHLVVKR